MLRRIGILALTMALLLWGVAVTLRAANERLSQARHEELREAALAGDTTRVSRILDTGAPINGWPDRPPDEMPMESPLCMAARKGHLQLVQFLVQHGADVNYTARMGAPLDEAACDGHMPIASYLISHGAVVNNRGKKPGDGGSNALWMAAISGHSSMVKLLLSSGADPNTCYAIDGSVLHIVKTQYYNSQIIRLLRNAGARDLPPSGEL